MLRWEEVDQAPTPDKKGELILRKRGTEFSIRTNETELMNSRAHGSEEALAELTCLDLNKNEDPAILIGGLGMGFTLAAALKVLPPDASIHVAELSCAVIQWNRQHLGCLANFPLDDPRVIVKETDVVDLIRQKSAVWDAILLDVDNGPEGLTQKSNNRLYSLTGLKKIKNALCPNGILGVWSAAANDAFTHRLKKAGFKPTIKTVRARKHKGGRHTIWLAQKTIPEKF